MDAHGHVSRKIRGLVRRGRYLLSEHAEEELFADGLSVLDLECIVLSGYVAERQRDEDTGAWKYVLEGPTRAGTWSAAVARFSGSDRLLFLTVFRL